MSRTFAPRQNFHRFAWFLVPGALLWVIVPPPLIRAAPAPLLTLQGHRGCIFHVVYSPDGKLLATSSKDRSVKLWNAVTGKELRSLIGHNGDVHSAAFSPDSRLLASAGEDHSIRIWDTASGALVRTLTGHDSDVYHVAFSPDGKSLASASNDETVRLWNVASGKVLHVLKGQTPRALTVSFSPEGRLLASSCPNSSSGTSNEVKLWDVASGQEFFSLPDAANGVVTVAFSPDGKRLAGSCFNGSVFVREMATGKETLRLHGHRLEAYYVVFSPDGRRLAFCSGKWNEERGGEIKVWDLASRQVIFSFANPQFTFWSVAFSPDGQRLAASSGKMSRQEAGTVQIWDLPRTNPVARPKPPTPRELQAWWTDLAGRDGSAAYRAMWAFSAAPRQALPFLTARVQPPACHIDCQRIATLINELDDDHFAVREKASVELANFGALARPALGQALRSPSPEVCRRVRMLLEKKNKPPSLSAEELRAMRVLEILEHIGTPEVLPLLKRLAEGAPGSLVTRDANAVRERLSQRKPHGDRSPKK